MIEQFTAIGNQRLFRKGTFLFRQGDMVENLYVIFQGLAKAYYETYEGKEFIKSFLYEGDIIASMQTIFGSKTSPFSVLCLEDCKVLAVPISAVRELMANENDFYEGMNSFLIKLVMKKERREYELLCLSSEERYSLFCEQEPGLLKRLSQNDIARYIGITPVALSRIRHRKPATI
jgi:CRP-like cAMP-binding protein